MAGGGGQAGGAAGVREERAGTEPMQDDEPPNVDSDLQMGEAEREAMQEESLAGRVGSDGAAEEECPASSLPSEILALVFALLSIPDRCRAGLACRRWHRASLQPPLSTSLRLTVLADLWEGDAGAVIRRRRAADRRRGRQRHVPDSHHERIESSGWRLLELEGAAVPACAAAAALRGPACAALEQLELRVAFSDGGPAPGGGYLPDVLAELPPSLRSLALAAPGWRGPAAALCGPLPLAERAPGLRSLILPLLDGRPAPLYGDEVPELASLEELGACVRISRPTHLRRLLAAVPALRLAWRLELDLRSPDAPAGALAALAARGIRCRSLRLSGADPRSGPAAALLLAPGEAGEGPVESGEPSGLAQEPFAPCWEAASPRGRAAPARLGGGWHPLAGAGGAGALCEPPAEADDGGRRADGGSLWGPCEAALA